MRACRRSNSWARASKLWGMKSGNGTRVRCTKPQREVPARPPLRCMQTNWWTPLQHEKFFFYCIAELAIKPCRSSRTNTRGGFEKFHDTCKTGNKHTTKQQNTQTNKQNTNTNDQRQVSLDGETSGEKRVKRPKLPEALMC